MTGKVTIVKLNAKEKKLYDSICWGSTDEFMKYPYEERLNMFERLGELTESLLKRKVIPKHRLDYFTDPELNFGGRGKSRKDIFVKNGTSGSDILRHPHFMPYLQYFINGPELPEETIAEFSQILTEDAGTTGMVLEQIHAYVRKEMRNRKLSKTKAPEEFAKLALEVDRPNLAPSVRSAAMSVR